jgi:hypothetical protein
MLLTLAHKDGREASYTSTDLLSNTRQDLFAELLKDNATTRELMVDIACCVDCPAPLSKGGFGYWTWALRFDVFVK